MLDLSLDPGLGQGPGVKCGGETIQFHPRETRRRRRNKNMDQPPPVAAPTAPPTPSPTPPPYREWAPILAGNCIKTIAGGSWPAQGQYSNFAAADLAACQAMCNNDATCKDLDVPLVYFTSGQCSVYHVDVEPSPGSCTGSASKYMLAATSAPTPPIPPGTWSDYAASQTCVRKANNNGNPAGKAYSGTDFKAGPSPCTSLAACQQACLWDAQCLAAVPPTVNFNSVAQTCTLYINPVVGVGGSCDGTLTKFQGAAATPPPTGAVTAAATPAPTTPPPPMSGTNDQGATNLQKCTGECDADSQCAAGLKCYVRAAQEPMPGCASGGEGDKTDWDYCYDPADVPPGAIELHGENNANTNLQKCSGECDANSQCAAGLKCFQRESNEPIPGCKGAGAGVDWDYCYDPLQQTTNTDGTITLAGANHGSDTNLQKCIGECDADSQCAAGLKCFQRENNEPIPGCSGGGGGPDWDYCYYPQQAAPSSQQEHEQVFQIREQDLDELDREEYLE